MERPLKRVATWYNVTPEIFVNDIQPLREPAILKGLMNQWPSVQASCKGDEALFKYLQGIYAGGKVRCAKLPAKERGLFFYNENFNGFNFTREIMAFDLFLKELVKNSQSSSADVIALQSAPLEDYFPKFEQQNAFNYFSEDYLSRVWIGNNSTVNAHYDDSENIACVVAGKRTFTLFPPDQIDNLYVGPIEFTPAGTPVSMVDFANIDYEKHPKITCALEHALEAELEPGDAVYIPTLWWHHVESKGGVNMLVNYWCGGAIAGKNRPVPQDNLLMAFLSIRSLPQAQKNAWREFFDYFVFSEQSNKHQHIPESIQGVLGELSPKQEQDIRQWLTQQLNNK